MLRWAKAVMDERDGREVRRPVRDECKRCDLALFGISNHCLGKVNKCHFSNISFRPVLDGREVKNILKMCTNSQSLGRVRAWRSRSGW